MEPLKVLVIGRDADAARALSADVTAAGSVCVGTSDSAHAAVASAASCDAFLAEAGSLGPDETEALLVASAKCETPRPCLVSMRGAGVDEAVDLMRRGAFAVLGFPAGRMALEMHLKQAASHRDLSARNAELERSLESHERLAMIGKLAAGVAHELNNPLDGVLRYVNFAIAKLPAEAEQVTYLLQARQGLRRMADIVRDLLQFSRNAAVDSVDEDAERMARDAVDPIVTAAAPRAVRAAYDFPQGGVRLPRAMFQVLGNLAKNAVDSMPSGGLVRVSATLASGRVRLDVADQGAGIPEEIRDRVFEPFFTTKEVGKGTGLGLSICQRIVERLGGTLSLESEVGRGTVIHIDLPVKAAPPARVLRAAPPKETAAAGPARAKGVF